jgi:dTDP-4-dehydrorhamnose 3,5-epimerase
MIIKKSKILKIHKIFPRTKFVDHRGCYLETYNKKEYKKKFNINFVEDNFSLNKKNVFKGIHGDHKTWKLISCIYGKCESIIVNCNKNSKDFGKSESFILDSNNYFQLLIPPGFGNSFLVLSDSAVYHYKQSSYYEGAKNQFTYNYKDPFFNIKLSKKKLIISLRDKFAKFINYEKD